MFTRIVRSRAALAVVALAVGASTASGIAYAASQPASATDVYYACVKSSNGLVRMSTARLNSPPAKCGKGETVKSWNAQGSQGLAGHDGAAGAPGTPGAAGAPGHDGAAGAPGHDGAAGAPGHDGAPGKDGGPGAPGEQGLQGEPGSPIFAAQPGQNTNGLVLTDATWTDVPGAGTEITVPSDTTALVDARWTGIINPGGFNKSIAMLRITIDGVPMQPDALDAAGVYYGQHITFERSLTGVSADTHTVQLQVSLSPCGGCTQSVNISGQSLIVEGSSE